MMTSRDRLRAQLGNSFNRALAFLATNTDPLFLSYDGAKGYIKKDIIGYKSVESYDKKTGRYQSCIATVSIPKGALVVLMRLDHGVLGAKFRTNNYKILAMETANTGEPVKTARSSYDPAFKYRVGRTYKQPVDTNISSDCSYGLHFLLTKNGARHYGR